MFSYRTALTVLAAAGATTVFANPVLVDEGPSPITGGQTEGLVQNAVAGAVNAIAAHPVDANILYAGGTNGGIWKTTDALAVDPTWVNQTDALPAQSIGDLVFDPVDATHQTLVAGIGLFSSYGRIGGAREGLLRTTDGGNTWTVIAPDLRTRNVSKLAVAGDRIVAAINFAEDFSCGNVGVYRSTDGGATFEQLTLEANGIPAGVSTVVTAQPGAPDVLYASVIFADVCEGSDNGIFRSDDGGASWTRLSDPALDATVTNDTGLTEIEIAPDGTVYVASTLNGRLAGVFQSTDNGTTWTAMDIPGTEEPGFVGVHPGGQGSIHFSLAIDPTDSNIVYVGGDRQPLTDEGGFPNAIGARDFSGRLFRGDISTPAGSQWAPLTHSGTAAVSSPHADSRDMAFDASGRLIESDDGGVYVRTDPRSALGAFHAALEQDGDNIAAIRGLARTA
ncbi:MAG: sialidase family protein, partial [Pseudomonadota bacterium]